MVCPNQYSPVNQQAQGASATEVLYGIIGKSARIRGIIIGPRSQYVLLSVSPISMLRTTNCRFENMNRLFDAAKIRPVIDRVFGFEEYPDALRHLASQKHVGKIVVKVA